MSNPPTMPVSEADLQAWADGRLDAQGRASVEAWLAAHPEELARLNAWRSDAATLAVAFAPVLDEPLPQRLLAAARAPARSRPRYLALAATLVLGLTAGWLARGMLSPAPSPAVASLPRQAMAAHAVYTPEVRHPVEVGASDDTHLVNWLSKRLGRKLTLPRLDGEGYGLVGGRLLPAEQGPAAQFMYQDGGGRRLTLYVRVESESAAATAFRFTEQAGVRVFYWVDGTLGYALSGDLSREELLALATATHRQLAP